LPAPQALDAKEARGKKGITAKGKAGQREGVAGGGMKEVRRRLWFEKFHWFVSSAGLLVLAGRDARCVQLEFGFRVSGFGFRVYGLRFTVYGLGFRVSGFGFQV